MIKIDEETFAALSAVEYPTPRHVKLVEQLDRKLYVKVNKALEALGGAWSRKDKVHVFAKCDAQPMIDAAITSGQIETGADVGFFETPEPLAAQLVVRAGVRRNHLVLEPSAGTGRIVAALQDVGAVVHACEWDLDRCGILTRDVLKGRDSMLASRDILDWKLPLDGAGYDRVVMNPPFCKVGKGDHLDHVRHAFSLLKPKGVLVSVLPSSVTFRRDRRYTEFRTWFEARGTLESLPDGSFKGSGTGVNTVVVRLVKESRQA